MDVARPPVRGKGKTLHIDQTMVAPNEIQLLIPHWGITKRTEQFILKGPERKF